MFPILSLIAAAPTPPPEGSSFGWEFFVVMAIIFAAFYFLISKPQQRAQAEKTKALDTMKKGAQVVSAGGIHGRVARVDKDRGVVLVTVAKGVDIEFNKTSLTVVDEEKEKAEEKK